MDYNALVVAQRASPVDQLVKNPPANAEDTGLIPGLGRSLEEEMVTHSSILAWRVSWTEEPGRVTNSQA